MNANIIFKQLLRPAKGRQEYESSVACKAGWCMYRFTTFSSGTGFVEIELAWIRLGFPRIQL